MDKYNLEYLNNLIADQVEENLHLDYKASGALARQNNKTFEISKDVSAMANADGGVLIYGIKEDEIQKHLPKEIQPINRKEFSKEWLEQVIQSNIQPRVNGIQIFPITIAAEEVVYIVDIPKSDTAHQAADKRYYKRFNFESTAMHDYEIRDILNRAKNPKIELQIKYSQNQLHISAFNSGMVYASYLTVKIRLPRKTVSTQRVGNKFVANMNEIILNNAVREMVNPYGQIATYYPPRYEPILPQTSIELCNLTLQDYPSDSETLEWAIYCDNATPVHGSIKLVGSFNVRR